MNNMFFELFSQLLKQNQSNYQNTQNNNTSQNPSFQNYPNEANFNNASYNNFSANQENSLLTNLMPLFMNIINKSSGDVSTLKHSDNKSDKKNKDSITINIKDNDDIII